MLTRALTSINSFKLEFRKARSLSSSTFSFFLERASSGLVFSSFKGGDKLARLSSEPKAPLMLLIDAEGHDHEVLEAYPFEGARSREGGSHFRPTRVVYERINLAEDALRQAEARLRRFGYVTDLACSGMDLCWRFPEARPW